MDVGYGQLAWKLRTDERVVNLERCNLRYIGPEQVPEPIDLAVMDVSFISIRLVLPAVKAATVRAVTTTGTGVVKAVTMAASVAAAATTVDADAKSLSDNTKKDVLYQDKNTIKTVSE